MNYHVYKFFDIFLLSALAIIAEIAGIGAAKTFFEPGSPLAFLLSLAVPVTLIIMVRWNAYGLLTAFALGITHHLVLASTNIHHLIIYSVGNLGLVVALIFMFKVGKTRIKEDYWMTSLFYIIGYLSIIVLRSVIASILGYHFLETLLNMLLQGEILSLIIGWIVILIARRQQNLMVDMKTYLLSFHKKDVNRDGQ